nr:hypothetical protein [Tanacetum cinerariifolium]
MATLTIHVPAKENLGDSIDIRMNIIYLQLVVVFAFPATTVVRTLVRHGEVIGGIQEQLLEMPIQRWEEIEEELLTQRERASKAETEGITLRARVRSLKLMETWFHGIVRDDRDASERLEHQLGLIQEELESLRYEIRHHPRGENVIADALSRKEWKSGKSGWKR